MVRQALRYQVLDSSGVPIAGASIQVAQVGTTDNITQTMYAGLTGVTTIGNPLTTDASGRVQAYFDGADAVALLRVTMIPTLTGFTFTSRDVQLGSDYGVLNAGDAPLKGTTVDANDRFNMARSTAGDPASLQTGDMWYNTTTNALHWRDASTTQTVSSTTGDITEVTAGDGLTGGGISGDVTLDVGDGNAIVASADAVDVSVNAASSAAAALAGDDKILISDTDDSNTTKSATIDQIDPTLLKGSPNNVYFAANSTGQITEVGLGAAGTVLTSSGATTAPAFSAAASVGNNMALFTNNTGVESGATIGAAGTVLTSNGIDTTANAPTWQTPAGGDTLSFTANGALTAGKAASLDADGKVSAAADTLAGNAIGSFTEWQTTGWHSGYGNFTVYDRNNSDHHLILGQNYQGTPPYYQGMASKVVQSNSSDTSAVFSSIVWNSVNVDNNGFDTLNAWYDDTANVCLVARRSGTNAYPYIQAATTSGTGTGASITWGTDTQITSYGSYGGCGVYIPDLGYSLYFWAQSSGGSNDGLFYKTITPSGTGSPTIGTEQRIYTSALSSTLSGVAAAYDDTNNVITVIFKDDTSTTNMMYIVGTVSGGAITWGTAATLTTLGSNDNSTILSYRSSDGKWFAMWSHQSSNETMTCCGTWTSGTTISWSVKEWTTADGPVYKINYPMMDMRDDGLARVSVFGRNYTGGVDQTHVYSFGLSGGDYILDLTNFPAMPDDSTGTSGSTQFGLSYSPDTGKYVANQWSWANPYDAGIYQPVTGSSNVSYTVGAAQTTVSDGQTVEVKSLGTTTSAGLSGLTIQGKVYVQNDGTLTNTVSSEHLGIAVAADTVLITKIGTNLT